jgi:hypothetical protein
MRIIDTFETGPSTSLGIKNCFDMGRTENFLKKFLNLCGYSNQMRLRHTFASQKMSTQASGQRALWTPCFGQHSFGGAE